MKIEYQSETNFIYHENLRFKKKEKSLRKVNGRQRHEETYIKSQNKAYTVGRIYIYLTHIHVKENLCQSEDDIDMVEVIVC